jgi:hypothetical protein
MDRGLPLDEPSPFSGKSSAETCGAPDGFRLVALPAASPSPIPAFSESSTKNPRSGVETVFGAARAVLRGFESSLAVEAAASGPSCPPTRWRSLSPP